MTLAAGFRCNDGIVLCADSQISQGEYGNRYKSKLFTLNNRTDCYLVYAGFTDFVRELVPQLEEIASKKEGSALLRDISKCYKAFHAKHYTRVPKSEKSFADIIFSIREGKRISLHVGSGKHCFPEEEYASSGTGFPVAEPLFNAFYSPSMNIRQALHLSIYVLRYIKGIGSGVGGNTSAVLIADAPSFLPNDQLATEEIKEIESDYDFLHKQMGKFLLTYPDLAGSEIASNLRRIASQLKRQRDKTNRLKDRERELWQQEEAREHRND
jgi:20S proteasome alpha/beta subunit